jgi:hypothetical protein
MVSKTTEQPAVRPELVELNERVERAELQARLIEAQVKMIKAREELQRLQGRAKT